VPFDKPHRQRLFDLVPRWLARPDNLSSDALMRLHIIQRSVCVLQIFEHLAKTLPPSIALSASEEAGKEFAGIAQLLDRDPQFMPPFRVELFNLCGLL